MYLPWSYTMWDTALGEFGCPFKFRCRYVDRIRPIGPPPSYFVKGRIAHTAMEGVMRGEITLDQVGVNPKTHEVIKHIQACEDKLVEYRLTVDREWKMVKGSVTWLVVKCDVVRQDDA